MHARPFLTLFSYYVYAKCESSHQRRTKKYLLAFWFGKTNLSKESDLTTEKCKFSSLGCQTVCFVVLNKQNPHPVGAGLGFSLANYQLCFTLVSTKGIENILCTNFMVKNWSIGYLSLESHSRPTYPRCNAEGGMNDIFAHHCASRSKNRQKSTHVDRVGRTMTTFQHGGRGSSAH